MHRRDEQHASEDGERYGRVTQAGRLCGVRDMAHVIAPVLSID